MTEQGSLCTGGEGEQACGSNEGRHVRLDSHVMNVDGCMTLEAVGLTLGHAAFETMLRAARIIDGRGLPYLTYIDDGFMAVMQSDAGGYQVIFTPAGLEWIGADERFDPSPATVAATNAGMQ